MEAPRKRKRDKPSLEHDCAVEVAAPNRTKRLKANSNRLKARSEMLAACFDGRWAVHKDKKGRTLLKLELPGNISIKSVKLLVQCMHKGPLPKKCRNDAGLQKQLLVAADYLQSQYCATKVLEQLIRLAPGYTWKQWREVQQVLAQQMQLPPELRTQLEVACSNWLPTQLHDLDAVVGTAMGSPEQQAADGQEEAEEGEEAVEEQEEEEGPAWRCFLLAQLSLGGLLDVLEKAQPRCPYQTTVLSAITVWAAARWPQQQQQQAQGEEVADACIPPEEALQLAGAVRLAGLPRSLLPCLQQLPWWRAAVSPEVQLEGMSLLLTAADSLLSLAPFTTPSPEADRRNGTVAVLQRVTGVAEVGGSLPAPLLGWFTPPACKDTKAAWTRLDLTTPSSLLAAALQDAIEGRNQAGWRQLDQLGWAGLVWRLGVRWVAFTAPLEGGPLAAAPAARRTRQQAAQQEDAEGQAGGSSSSGWEHWALDVEHLGEEEAQAELARVAADCWGLQVCVTYALPGVDHPQLLMDPPALVSPGARLAPGERRPLVYKRAVADPSRGTVVLKGGEVLVVQQVVPLLEVIQQLRGTQEGDKPGVDIDMLEGLPAQDEQGAEAAGVGGRVQGAVLPEGSITLKLELGPLY